MPIETATLISDLNVSYPQGTDPLADADDHIRLVKSALKNTFPSVTGALTGTHTAINRASTAFSLPGVVTIEASGTIEGGFLFLRGPTGGNDVKIVNNGTVAGAGGLKVDIETAAGTLQTALTLSQTGAAVLTTSVDAPTVKQGGNKLIPTGIITLWFGSVASIPAGWVICNGANGTPDLRNVFVMGAGSTYSPGGTGGAASVGITTSTAPTHSHGGVTGTNGAHSHTGSTGDAGTHSHSGFVYGTAITVDQMPSHAHQERNFDSSGGVGGPNNHPTGGGGGGTITSNVWTESQGGNQMHNHAIAPDGNHAHSVSISTDGDHSHTIADDNAHSHTATVTTLPPFKALCYIMKL